MGDLSRTGLGSLWRSWKRSPAPLARIGPPFELALGAPCMVSIMPHLIPQYWEADAVSLIGMRMDDPKPTFAYLAQKIKERYPNFAFLDAVEVERPRDGKESNEFLREVWSPKVLISNSGYDRKKGMELADRTGGLVSYGKYFLANVGIFSSTASCIVLTMRITARLAV